MATVTAAPYKYANADNTIVVRLSDGATIPLGQPTGDSRAVADYLASGGVIDAFTPAPVNPLAAILANGIQIISTSTPALNASYDISDAQTQIITGIAAGIAARNRLPGGGATFNYPDIAGNQHAFGASDFLNFASAVEDFRYSLSQGVIPALPVTIP